jgi:two-component system OmpR family response regulator
MCDRDGRGQRKACDEEQAYFDFHGGIVREGTLREREAKENPAISLAAGKLGASSSTLKVDSATLSAPRIGLRRRRRRDKLGARMRLLVVEDEPDLLASLARALREEGYAVDTAADGQDGFYKAESYDYDAVILDVMLPKLDGWEILKRLRKTKKTPVLMLTAKDQSRDRVKGLDTGADDYVVKPFDLHELFARLRALIRRSANKTTNVIEIGSIKIDTAARNILHTGKPVELTAREYALVEFLALHRGEVVTRTTLYEHLFDEDDSTLSNLLDVHVSNVRKKLGAEFITTRRGHGYCIE